MSIDNCLNHGRFTKNRILIKNALIVSGSEVFNDNLFIDKEGFISNIINNKIELENYNYGDEVIDCKGENYVIPGFIDIHTHGFSGHSTEEDVSGLRNLAIEYAKRGTLGFCPTIGPRSFETYLKIIDAYKEAFSGDYKGARFLGLHLEGPYLSPKKAGAIDPDSMYSIDLKALDSFLLKTKGYIKIMSIAPEVPFAKEAVELLLKYNIIPSAGHTNANYNETRKCIDAGLCQATHMFNAMRPLHHREPGVIGALLNDDNVYCELIADGVHVNTKIIELLLKVKGFNKVAAVSDGGDTCGIDYEDGHILPDGSIIRNGAVYCTDGETLSGSTRDVYSHFKSFINKMNIKIWDSVKLTSTNAAESLKLNFGSIKVSKKANILIINKDFDIKNIIIEGKEFR